MKTDVVIIGSGAGGGPLALALSRAGCKVLVLEKGPLYSRGDYCHDEILASEQSGFFIPRASQDPHVVVMHGPEGPLEPETSNLGWIGSCVGGGTVRMGGYLFRLHPDELRLRSLYGDYELIEDWPFSYNELEPYYCRAEWEVGVAGAAGSNPFEGPRSKPYPMPAIDVHPVADTLDRVCRRLGLTSFPTPRAVNSRPYQGRPKCSYCDFCAAYGCPTGAKGSSQEALLSRAVETGRCDILPKAMVREVTLGRDGRASGCVFLDESGKEHEVSAKVTCISCSPIESARLLLLSKSPRFPDGLANGSGLVGRNLQLQISSRGSATFRCDRHPEMLLRERGPFLGRSLMDYYFLPPGVSDFPTGGLLRFGLSGPDPIANAHRLASRNGTLIWGNRLKRRLWEYYNETREVFFEVFQDFVPNVRTHVVLDPEAKDKWGLPSARLFVDRPAHHARAAQWLVDRGLEIFEEMGADQAEPGIVAGISYYLLHGTCRAGKDRETSVLNEYCQSHEVPNLFVVDGSFMPTSGIAPPTLTILANSFRTADHIISRFESGEFES